MGNLEQIKDIVEPILKRNDVEFAGIFGSYARGEADTDSDVDLLVRFSRPKSLLKLIRLENEIQSALETPVDVVTERAVSSYLKDAIFNDLHVLYGTR